MVSYEGWFLDTYILNNEAIVWIKTDNGKLIRLRDDFINSFYVETIDQSSLDKLMRSLADIPAIQNLICTDKFVSLKSSEKKRLLKIELKDSSIYKNLVKYLEGNKEVRSLYNTDLKFVQKYLFEKIKIEPTSKVVVDCKGDKLINISKVDDSNEIIPPPFSILFVDVKYRKFKEEKVLESLEIFDGSHLTLKGNEKDILEEFNFLIKIKDPDLIYFNKVSSSFPALISSARKNFEVLNLERFNDKWILSQGSCGGRIILGNIFYGFSANKFGIAGLIERTRFAFVPVGLATRWLSNKSIDSRNCFELIQRGYVIPKEEYYEPVRNLLELAQRDRGGITFSPEFNKIHENVAEIDFDSEYPSIILKNKLSYESVSYSDSFKLMPEVIRPWLERRLFLKNLVKNLKGEEKLYCEERTNALKLILVTFYGISGCCWNRFGNVITFEEINRVSREIMRKAKEIIEANGFKLVYGDVDSLFVTKKNSSLEDYCEIVDKIKSLTGFSASLKRHFKFLVFLRTKYGFISALKRYFGITYEGDVEARGIEFRRKDFPSFIKEFQIKLIKEILSFDRIDEIYKIGIFRGLELLKQTLNKIRNRQIPLEELIVTKRLGKDIASYKANVVQKLAAFQLIRNNYEIRTGEQIQLIYKDGKNFNKACAYELSNEYYSSEIYSKLLYSSAETIYRGIGIDLKQLLRSYDIKNNLLEWFN